MASLRKKGLTALKIVVSGLLLYFVLTKIEIDNVGQILREAHPLYLLMAIGWFALSKFIAALRLNLYFHQIDIPLPQKENLQLYLLGMFYNLFLPGGIGGDAYKGYILQKKFRAPTKRLVSVLVLDRLSGLLLLFIYACSLAFFITIEGLGSLTLLLLPAMIVGTLLFLWIHYRFFRYVMPIFWKSFGLSALVQLAQLASVLSIIKALGITSGMGAYLLIFLISSIVSVIPLTIGGIGSREATFYYGSKWLNLAQDASVGISMTFFLITALVSLMGAYYHFKGIQFSSASSEAP
ncbi:MAG: lysylphosphatidylglycerol synthase transmembrane domain-containing protein [Flavobacteriaceae bacterium]